MKKVLLGIFALLCAGILIGYAAGWYFQQAQPPVERIPILVEEVLPEREVQLYFIHPEGRYLVPEARQIPGCEDDRDCVRSLLELLRGGSDAGNLGFLPEATGILDIEIENDLVKVNFSRHISDHHPGGSLSELLTVFGLANSISENFPYLRQLQILIDGQVQQTLKGHVRIDQPVYPDFNFSREPLPGPVPEPAAEPQRAAE